VSHVLAWLASFMRETINEKKPTHLHSKSNGQSHWNYMARQNPTQTTGRTQQKKNPEELLK
jgi:hypothetical protein